MKEETKKRRSTFAVLFYLNRAKIKKNGLCPVMGRITIDTQVAQFSAKTDANPDTWDAKTGRAIGRNRQSLEINITLNRMEQKINGYYTEIVEA